MASTAAKERFQARQQANRERMRRAQARERRRRRVYLFGAGVVADVVVVIAAAMLTRNDLNGAPAESATILPAVVAAEPLDATIPRHGRTLGNHDAQVVLVEWADYQCPFCGAFAREIMPRVIDDFVKTGLVRVEFSDLPFLDSATGYGESDMAAEAAACAADQDRFWDYQHTIFANQFGENMGAYSAERLMRMAELTGLDTGQFAACVEDRTHTEAVRSMQAEAVEMGITSTPTLVINGKIVRYTGRYEDLKAEIEAALAAA